MGVMDTGSQSQSLVGNQILTPLLPCIAHGSSVLSRIESSTLMLAFTVRVVFIFADVESNGY